MSDEKRKDIAASLARSLRIFGASGVLRDLTVLAGAGCVSYGAWLLSHPIGFIVGGVLLIAGAVVQELAHGAD